MYGKEFMGVLRTTFLIGAVAGLRNLVKVKVDGHAEAVLECSGTA